MTSSIQSCVLAMPAFFRSVVLISSFSLCHHYIVYISPPFLLLYYQPLSLSHTHAHTQAHARTCADKKASKTDIYNTFRSWTETFHFVEAQQMDAGIVMTTHTYTHTCGEYCARTHVGVKCIFKLRCARTHTHTQTPCKTIMM